MRAKSKRLAAIAVLLGVPLAAPGETLGIGRVADDADVARWDIDVGPDGVGLPAGGGTATQGEPIYLAKCASCHGDDGQTGMDKLAGAERRKTIGSFWPYATTIFDYVRRAMPTTAPGSLTDDEVYALTAYLLYLNDLVPADRVIDAQSLPLVAMPARDRYVADDRRGGPEVR